MKKFLIVSGSIVVILAVSFFGFLAYLGSFSEVSVQEKTTGPFTYVYRDHTGPYQGVGLVFENVNKLLAEVGIDTSMGIGIYYDDPEKVPAEKLRCRVGVIVSQADLEIIKSKLLEIKSDFLPPAKSIVVDFPMRNLLSFMIGPMKAYPALMEFATGNSLNLIPSGIEIYDQKNAKIYYSFRLGN